MTFNSEKIGEDFCLNPVIVYCFGQDFISQSCDCLRCKASKLMTILKLCGLHIWVSPAFGFQSPISAPKHDSGSQIYESLVSIVYFLSHYNTIDIVDPSKGPLQVLPAGFSMALSILISLWERGIDTVGTKFSNFVDDTLRMVGG